MIKIDIQDYKWHIKNDVYVRGYCFDKTNKIFEGETLIELFSSIKDIIQFNSLLKNINGIFSVIIKKEDSLFAASDKTDVYPLYYSSNNKDFTISENPYRLLSKNPQINNEAKDEFLLSSYTLDEKTLIEDIYQIKPSCYLYFNFNNKKIIQNYYFSYGSRESELNFSEGKVLDTKFKTILENVFQRLIKSANGRQIAIPLSGGYDSRLIVTMLKKLRYKNVICYTVGAENNPEYKIAKEVAKKLGYPYHFIFTGDKKFTENYISDKTFQAYYKFSGSLSQSFWMYEYFGLKYLIDKNIVDKDSIFVPGHSGDFFAGSQITYHHIDINNTIQEVVNKIAESNYKFNYPQRNDFKKIIRIMDYYGDCTNYSKFENFLFLVRLPKLINNSARIYEFFGYDVRLPFWDNDIIDFFRVLPLMLKKNKKFYSNFLKKNLFAAYNLNFEEEIQPHYRGKKRQRLLNFIKLFLPKFIFRFKNRNKDITCMKEITAPLRNDLKKKGIKLKTDQYNEVFLQWYLVKIKDDLGFD